MSWYYHLNQLLRSANTTSLVPHQHKTVTYGRLGRTPWTDALDGRLGWTPWMVSY